MSYLEISTVEPPEPSSSPKPIASNIWPKTVAGSSNELLPSDITVPVL